MFKNYFKTAWRSLLKNKFYSLINISGLTVGLAIGILLLLWVQDEFSYDRFHSNAKNIYKLENMVGTGSSRQLWTSTASPIGVLAKKEIPGVEEVTRITNYGFYGLFKYKEKTFSNENYFFTDPSFFSLFDFKLISGNASNPFPDDNSVVLTEESAKKYFGDDRDIYQNALGKIIIADDSVQFKVSGVIKDFPKNSSIRADMIFPISIVPKHIYKAGNSLTTLDNDFIQYNYNTYLQLKPGFSFTGFADKLRQIHLRMKSDDTDIGYVLLPLAKIHLFRADGGDGGFATVSMFAIIAILILVIACINYINLSTARSMLRAKEVSLRKIVGAGRIQLFIQFITETALLFVLSTFIALILVYLLVPIFNSVSGKQLSVNFADYHIWQVIIFTITGTLIISSIYPALLLSSFQPIKTLRGKISTRISNALFRKILVVTQFTFSVILITGTIIIGKQLNYIHSKELGYNKENVLSFNLINMNNHMDAVKSDLMKQPGISDVTWSSSNIINIGGQTGDNSWDGKQNGETMMLSPMSIDKDFFSFFKMQLVSGSGFTGTPADSTHFILNETAVKAARIKDPIGKKFRLWQTEGTIIGVMKDFHFASMRQLIQPAIFYYQPMENRKMYVKTTNANASKAINATEAEWKKYNPEFPFNYTFLDESFDRLYKSEQRTGLLSNAFSIIAIFISCLGLFGLATYTAQTRTREIGVRKVLGASISSVMRLLATDFIKLVMIAIVIAVPVAWYIMNKWLQDFAYKINIGWAVFFIAGLIAILIAMLTISFQAIKAAIANPIKSLRTE